MGSGAADYTEQGWRKEVGKIWQAVANKHRWEFGTPRSKVAWWKTFLSKLIYYAIIYLNYSIYTTFEEQRNAPKRFQFHYQT